MKKLRIVVVHSVIIFFLLISNNLEVLSLPSLNGTWHYSYLKDYSQAVSGNIRGQKNETLEFIISGSPRSIPSDCYTKYPVPATWILHSSIRGDIDSFPAFCTQSNGVTNAKFTFTPDSNSDNSDSNSGSSGSGSGSSGSASGAGGGSGSGTGGGSGSGNGGSGGNGNGNGGDGVDGGGGKNPPPPPPPSPSPSPSTPPPTPTPTPTDACAILHPETETPSTLLQAANLLASVLPQTPDSMRLPTLISQMGGQGSLAGNLGLEIYSAAWQYFGIIAFIKFYKLIPGKMS